MRTLRILDIGREAYDPVCRMQEELVLKRRDGVIPDTLILVEHDPVYTLGRNARESNVVASSEELAAMGIPVVKTSRGGDVTYHGPGQLVGYPIMDLAARGEGVLWYVSSLEQVIVKVLGALGIEGTTERKNRGVWVGNEKVAAIGVRVTRHITMHGFSLNVCVDLKNYGGIIPCGISDKGVTSLHLLVRDAGMERVKGLVAGMFAEVFGYEEVESGRGVSGHERAQ